MSGDSNRGCSPVTCDACGMDLTPTPEQIRALHRFGNPLRRQPCLETKSGLHVVNTEHGEVCDYFDCGGFGTYHRAGHHRFDR